MGNAAFIINPDRMLARIVDGIDNGLDMNDRDAMGDVYEYVLGKMAASGNNGQFRTPRHIIRMMVELMQPERLILLACCAFCFFFVSRKEGEKNKYIERRTLGSPRILKQDYTIRAFCCCAIK